MAATKSKGKASEESTGEVEVLPSRGVSMSSRQNAVELVTNLSEIQEQFGAPVSWQDIEPTFPVIKKETLEGVPFIIVGFRMNESKEYLHPDEQNPDVLVGNYFMSLLVACYDEDSGDLISPFSIVNDGGTGIRDQVTRYVKRASGDSTVDASKEFFNAAAAKCPPIKIENGLRPSRYDYTDPDTGKVSKATTWYLS